MKNTQISDFWFYKFRYQITYGAIFVTFLAIIFHTIFVAPNALTQQEIQSATASANLSLADIFSQNILDFPFRILQNFSINIFGLSNFSIKLPAILIAIATIFAIIKLSRIWFSQGSARLTALIAVASSQFFFVAQNGTPEIMYIFYPILLILAGGEFLKTRKPSALFLLMAILALSLYTPLSIYIAIALFLTILLHPHLRFVIKRETRQTKIIAITIFTVIIAPLLIAIIKSPEIIKLIFGLPEKFNLLENTQKLFANLFLFSGSESSGAITPIVNPVVACLVVIGIFFSFISKHTAKSYLLAIWTVILLATCAINPSLTTILFTPILLLTITGLQSLFQTWYTIFPRNPYPRVLGIFPILILVAGLFFTSINNLYKTYIYSPEIVAKFNPDLHILLENTTGERNLLVGENERAFYQILVKKSGGKLVENFSEEQIIVSKTAFEQKSIPQNYQISKILTSARQNNADRFYILKKR